MINNWAINGQAIPIPDSFSISPFDIERRDRTASGKLVKEIIATKDVYTIIYNSLTGNEVQILKSFRQGDFVTLEYFEGGQFNEKLVEYSSFDRQLVIQEPEHYMETTLIFEEV